MNKPAFDPSQPFDAPSKPAFDPSQPFDAGDPSLLQKAAQLSAVPRNGLRGLAVGAENLMEGHGLQPSLAAASDATQQNYKPKEGEHIANLVANGLDPRLLATGLIAAPAGAGLAMRAAMPLVQGAAAGGTVNALSGLEDTGKTSVGEVAKGAAAGAASGGVLSSLGAILRNAPELGGKIMTALVRSTGGVRPGATEAYSRMMAESPSAMRAALGTADAQQSTTNQFRDAVQKELDAHGQAVRDIHDQLGIRGADVSRPDLDTLISQARQVINSPIPQPAMSHLPVVPQEPRPMLALPAPQPTIPLPGDSITGPSGVIHTAEPYYKYRQVEPEFKAGDAVSQPSHFLPPTPETFKRPSGTLSSDIPSPQPPPAPETNIDRIRKLVHLKSNIDNYSKSLFSDPNSMPNVNSDKAKNLLKGLRFQINQQLSAIPEAAPLRSVDADFSDTAKAYSTLKGLIGNEMNATSKIGNLANAEDMSTSESQRPFYDAAVGKMGPEVQQAYQGAKAEAIKRSLDTPIARIQNNPARILPAMGARAILPGTMDLSAALNKLTPAASKVADVASSIPAKLSLIAALMQADKNEK